jgi:ParB family chromosome partitioning protein
MVKRGLGRGLGALIPTAAERSLDEPGSGILEIPLEKIIPNSNQPRHNFSKESLDELAESIKEFGVIQPILVRRLDKEEKYEIIAGGRRYKAAKKLGMDMIPSIVSKDVDDISSLELALIENIHREDLSPIELSHTFKQLIEEFHITHEELSEKIGKSRTAITNLLRLLTLPLEVQKLLDEKKVDVGHARAIAGLKKMEDQVKVANLVVEKGLSVREVEKIVNKKNNLPDEAKRHSGRVVQFSKLSSVSKKIADYVNAPVKINVGKKKGKIEITFGSVRDLERIVHRILG